MALKKKAWEVESSVCDTCAGCGYKRRPARQSGKAGGLKNPFRKGRGVSGEEQESGSEDEEVSRLLVTPEVDEYDEGFEGLEGGYGSIGCSAGEPVRKKGVKRVIGENWKGKTRCEEDDVLV